MIFQFEMKRHERVIPKAYDSIKPAGKSNYIDKYRICINVTYITFNYTLQVKRQK